MGLKILTLGNMYSCLDQNLPYRQVRFHKPILKADPVSQDALAHRRVITATCVHQGSECVAAMMTTP